MSETQPGGVILAPQVVFRRLKAPPHFNMASAEGKTPNGLAAFKTYEDPAWSWIDLVAACKTGDPAVVRACMQIAKQSNWTHDQWEMAIELIDDDEDHTWHEDLPDDCIGCSPEPNPGWNRSDEEIDTAHTMMNMANKKHQNQKTIDDFFEE